MLVPYKDIEKETIEVTFGNGSSGEYPLAMVRVTFDGEEYLVRAAVVQGLPEDVHLGRDVPLHKHMVKRLSKNEQMELLQQLAKDHQVHLSEGMDRNPVLTVTIRAQRKTSRYREKC